jgi:DNA ligase-1
MQTTRRHLIACGLGSALLPFSARANRHDQPGLLLAHVAPPDIDPAPYLVSEKYDGVRALWDGQALRFRSGRPVMAPGWFTAALPAHPLDGELWIARGRFEAVSGTVRKQSPVDAEWRRVRYMVFELPQAPGSFEARLVQLRGMPAAADSPVQPVAQERIADRAALQRRLAAVVRGGGEGLMLHRADALYATGRHDALLKLKPIDDAEATVVAWVPGQGRFSGLMGALDVQTPAGRRFRIGTGFSDALRREPPAIGSVLTYTHRGFTRDGLPRFASYLRPADSF